MMHLKDILVVCILTVVVGVIVGFSLRDSLIIEPSQVVYEYRNHKALPDGQHRYEVYYRLQRVGHVTMPHSLCGVESVIVAVDDHSN